jgi:hypothetical protein
MLGRISVWFKAAVACGALSLSACAAGGSSLPAANGTQPGAGGALHAQAKGAAGGGGGGGGITQIPPPPTIDGPAWFVYNASAVIGTVPSADVNFDALQNTVQGGISIGAVRSATVMIFNTSKKTPLTVTAADVVGANAADFTISPASRQAALGGAVPPNSGSATMLQIAFSPTAEGARSATLRLVSNAGTALAQLTGTGLPARPVIATATGPLTFLAASAPDTLVVSNLGGQALVLSSIVLGGADPGAFAFTVANKGFSNCYAGIPLSPHGSCYIGIGLAAGAPVPSNATLTILSNDPVQPETDIPLALTP